MISRSHLHGEISCHGEAKQKIGDMVLDLLLCVWHVYVHPVPRGVRFAFPSAYVGEAQECFLHRVIWRHELESMHIHTHASGQRWLSNKTAKISIRLVRLNHGEWPALRPHTMMRNAPFSITEELGGR